MRDRCISEAGWRTPQFRCRGCLPTEHRTGSAQVTAPRDGSEAYKVYRRSTPSPTASRPPAQPPNPGAHGSASSTRGLQIIISDIVYLWREGFRTTVRHRDTLLPVPAPNCWPSWSPRRACSRWFLTRFSWEGQLRPCMRVTGTPTIMITFSRTCGTGSTSFSRLLNPKASG